MKISNKNSTPQSTNKYLIIGYGKFGKGFAQRLLKEGVKESKIYIVDRNLEMLEEAKNQFSNVMCLPITDFDSLNAFDVNEIKIVVIAMSDLEESLMIAANCVKYPDKKYFAKAKNEIHSKLLRTLGIDNVVIPEEEIGSKLAYESLFKSNVEIINVDDYYNILHIKVKENNSILNKTLMSLNIRSKIECTIFGIKRDNKFFIPAGDDVIKANDIISVVYKKEQTKDILQFFDSW